MNLWQWFLLGVITFAPSVASGQPLPPRIRQAVDRACQYLKTAGVREASAALPHSHRLGLNSLVLLALHKAEAVHPTDTLVRELLASIRQDARHPGIPTDYAAPYAVAVAITVLSEVDPQGSAAEIQHLHNILVELQMPHGGFSCKQGPGGTKQQGGDTSMTQYGALAFWALDQSGAGISHTSWQNLASWLIRTQDSSGGYVYEPARQGVEISPSLGTTAAALSALYICQARAKLKQQNKPPEEAPHPALEKVHPPGVPRKLGPISLPVDQLAQAAQRAEQWMTEQWKKADFSFEKIEQKEKYLYYFLYSLERYYSFRELVDPKSQEDQLWYKQGVSYLLKHQRPNGSWELPRSHLVGSPRPAPTAFAVLFLVRGTRKMLQKVPPASGKLIGGRGLPPLGSPLELKDGQVRVKPLKGPADQLLKIVGNPNDPRFYQALAALEEMSQEPDPRMLSKLERQLRQLAQSNSPEAKVAALKTLVATGKMDVVPLLIRLLEDPHPQVMLAARNALRRLSRRMEGFGLPDHPSPEQRRRAIQRWKQWFQTVRPDVARELTSP